MLDSAEQVGSATLLEPNGIQNLSAEKAIKCLIEPMVKNHPTRGSAYGVLVYGHQEQGSNRGILQAVSTFLKAYRRLLNVVDGLDISALSQRKGKQFEVERVGDVKFYVGQAAESVLEKKVELSPGVYIMTSLLDETLLESLDLPALPERFRQLPMIVQIENPVEANVAIEEAVTPIREPINSFETRQESERINRDTREWRKEFIDSIPTFNSAEVAEEAASSAGNKAALASRWLNEKKIFAVQFRGQNLFPRFQFLDGRPAPIIERVIEVFPRHANGWDYAYFFSTPNPFIGNRKPLELLRTDPDRVISLARTFVHPANVF